MAQASKSQIINKLKTNLKGSWKDARKVEPKARGAGGLPPNLKNAVGVCKTYKLDQTQKGDPFFSLGLVMKEPDDLVGRRATINWFINESEFQTVEEAAQQLANDLGLMLPDQDIPEDPGEIVECLKDLCERGVHVLINTGRERTKGRSPNIFVQGLAEGWDDAPEEGAGEAQAAADRAASRRSGTGGDTSTTQTSRGGAGSNGAASTSPTKRPTPKQAEPAPEPEPEPEAQEYREEPEGGEQEGHVPEPGDIYGFKAPKTKEVENYEVTACDAKKETVDLKQAKVKRGQKALAFSKVPWAKLEQALD